MSNRRVIFFGSSGGCLDAFFLFDECFDESKYKKLVLSDEIKSSSNFLGAKVLGGFKEILDKTFENTFFVYQCGNFSNVFERDKWFLQAIKSDLRPLSLISPLSYIHHSAKIGEGSIIYPGVKIMRNVLIGKNCIILPNAVINHDASIGDFSIINSSVVINGDIVIGKKNYIGSGAIIREKIKTVNSVKIGMGSIVTKNLEETGIYYGNPAKKKNAYNWSGEQNC